MLTLPADGGCACALCRYRVTGQPFVVYACHCAECRRLTASAFLLCAHVAAECVTLTRGSPGQRDRVAATGNRLRTWFCPECGSSLFARNSVRPRIRTVHAATLDRVAELDLRAHIWVDSKLPWVHIPTTHRRFPQAGDFRGDYARDPTRHAAPSGTP